MGKRILSLLLSVIMILSLAPVTFAASENISIVSSEGTSFSAEAGDTFTVTLSNKAMKVSSFAAGINFDREKLEVTEIIGCYDYNQSKIIVLEPESGFPLPPTATSNVSEANANGTVGATFAGTQDTEYKGADIFTVTFKVKSNVSGEAKITMFEDSAGTSGYKADPISTGAITANIVIPATAISIIEATATTYVNENVQLTLEKTPTNTTSEVEWTSSNNNVATVDSTGKVSGVAAGEVTITAKSKDDGTIKDTCTVTVGACNHNYGDLIPEVPATCLETGTAAHYKCSKCQRYFNESKEEISEEDTVIPANGHSWSNDLVNTDSEGHYYKCTIEGCNAMIADKNDPESPAFETHTFNDEYEIGTAENGIGEGFHALKCSVCGYVDVDNKVAHKYNTFMPNAEDKNTKHTFQCVCGATKSDSHEAKEGWTSGDTTHWHECKTSGCTHHIDEATHAYVNEVVDEKYIATEATCTANAFYYKSCVCGKASTTETFEEEGTKLPHTLESKGSQEPTCTEHGWKEYWQCQVCGEYYSDKTGTTVIGGEEALESWRNKTGGAGYIKPAGHTFTVFVSSDAAGHTYKCSKCDATETTAHNHNGNEGKLKKDKTGHWYVCSCGYEPVDKVAHNYNTIVCTEKGTCTDCGCERAAGQHSWNDGVQSVAPTCKTKGKTTYTCLSCSATETREDINALGHSYGDPTYSWDGNQCTATRTCSVCADGTEEKTQEEKSTGAYIKDTDATCTKPEKGHYHATFTNVAFSAQDTAENSVTNTEVPALGHDYTGQTISYVWSENDTICTASVDCKRKGCTHTETEVANAVYTMTAAADCTNAEKGKYDATFKNTTLFQAQTKVHDGKNPALGHNYSNEWTSDGTQHWHKCLRPGCNDTTVPVAHNYTTFKGSDATTHTYECVCGATKTTDHNHDGNGKNLKKDETGHWYVCSCGYEKLGFEAHTFDETDCTKTGTCSCGYVRPAGTHSWGTAELVTPATCTTAGTNKYTCASCSATEYRNDIAALGHIVESDSLAATCKTAGYKAYYTCTRDGCSCKNKYYTDSALVNLIGDGTALATWKAEGGDGYIAALGHSFTLTSSKAATCTVNGEKVYTCERCNETNTEVITAHHTYGADGVCTGCGATLAPEDVTKVESAVGEVKSGTGDNTATVNTPAMEILNAVAGGKNGTLPADIVEKIADGATLSVTFNSAKTTGDAKKNAESIAENFTDEVKSESKGGEVTVSAPIEIDLSMLLCDKDGNQVGDGAIHNLSQPIEIAISVPADIKALVEQKTGKVIEYFVLRIHGEGASKQVDILPAWVDGNGNFCFDTDKLSTFVPMVVISDPEPEKPHHSSTTVVIGKKDTKEEKPEVEENPNTGAEVPNFGMALVILGAACVVASKKRK